jgi:3-methyladenine DNA glycosylase Mpg
MATIFQTSFVPENFPYLANRILNYMLLMVNGHPHRICEIEFYLNSAAHPDSYVHGHADQTKNGTWYFHRHNTGTYKGGTFKGVDIVTGYTTNNSNMINRPEGVYGAILIRSIIDIHQRKFIEGPCRCVDHILALSGVDTIIGLTGNHSLNVLHNDRRFVLIEGNPSVIEPLMWGPRIGLSDKYPEYRDKPYRYVIGPVKKERKKMTLCHRS